MKNRFFIKNSFLNIRNFDFLFPIILMLGAVFGSVFGILCSHMALLNSVLDGFLHNIAAARTEITFLFSLSFLSLTAFLLLLFSFSALGVFFIPLTVFVKSVSAAFTSCVMVRVLSFTGLKMALLFVSIESLFVFLTTSILSREAFAFSHFLLSQCMECELTEKISFRRLLLVFAFSLVLLALPALFLCRVVPMLNVNIFR